MGSIEPYKMSESAKKKQSQSMKTYYKTKGGIEKKSEHSKFMSEFHKTERGSNFLQKRKGSKSMGLYYQTEDGINQLERFSKLRKNKIPPYLLHDRLNKGGDFSREEYYKKLREEDGFWNNEVARFKNEIKYRDNTIVKLYTSDSKKYSYGVLAEKYNVSINRINKIILNSNNGYRSTLKLRNAKIRELVKEDPRKWTIKNLAIHFTVSHNVIRKSIPGFHAALRAKREKIDTSNIIKLLKERKALREISATLNLKIDRVVVLSRTYREKVKVIKKELK